MQNLHLKLTSKYPKYNNWHQAKHHNKIHWGVFFIYSLLIFSFILNPLSFSLDSNNSNSSLKVFPSTSQAQTTLEIPLSIEEPAGIPRTNEPVSSGIPLPQGTIVNTQEWSLWDGARELPLQVTKLPGRTPWILLDFPVSLNANQKKTLSLKQIPSTTLSSNPLTITEDTNQVAISNNIIKTTISKTTFNLLEEVWLDKNNNQSFDQGEEIITPQPDNIQIIDSTTNQTFSGKGTPTNISWEYQGPLRSTLRVDGRYTNGTMEFIAYTTRLTFYAGRSDVKIEHILRNSYQPNERHVKIKSATLKIGEGAILTQATRPGSVSWTNIDSGGTNFEIVPTTLWNIDSIANDGILLPDLSYHGATLIIDFSERLSPTEQTRRGNAVRSSLFAVASPSWYSEYGELSTSKFSTLEDEKQAYQQWRWAWTPDQEPTDLHQPDYVVSWKNISVHDDSEADDLWQNILMYLRTGSRGYLDRATGWARYYKWEYAFRTDGFDFAWDGGWENPKVARPELIIPLTSTDITYLKNDVKRGKIDVRGWGADHLYGWGLIDYYYLTGDVDTLEAAVDVAEISERIFGWRVPGNYSMGFYGMRQGARHLLFISRLYAATQSPRWQNLMNHLAQLWFQSPDWDVRGFYPYGKPDTDKKIAPGAYDSGARLASGFQLGLLSHALERYYNLTGNMQVKDRVIAMAQWVKQYGLHPTYLYSGSEIALDYPSNGDLWHNYFASEPITYFNPLPTIWLIDSLVRGYRFTEDKSFLAQAKLHWERASKAKFGIPITRIAGETEVGRFMNDRFTTGRHIYVGNGDIGYSHLLFSDYIRHNTADITPPSIPTSLTGTVISAYQINLSWDPSTDNVGVTGYRIYRDGLLIVTTTNTTYTDTGLTPSTTYTYTVSAIDVAGNESAQSASISKTTLTAPVDPLVGTWLMGASGSSRKWFPMVYDPDNDDMIIFGGGHAGSGATGLRPNIRYSDFMSGGYTYDDYPPVKRKGGYINDIQQYDYKNNLWTELHKWDSCSNDGQPGKYDHPFSECVNGGVYKPYGRDNHMMTYDTYNKVFWVYGGYSAADGWHAPTQLWKWDRKTNTWTRYSWLFDNQSPHKTQMMDGGFAYNPDNKTILLANLIGTDTTHIWDTVTETWSKPASANSPNPHPPLTRKEHENSLVYDTVNHVFIFPYVSEGEYLDTWIFHPGNNTWEKKEPAIKPLNRYQTAVIFNPNIGKAVLFGGTDLARTKVFNDLWTYDYATNTWENITPPIVPPDLGRRLHGMAFSPIGDTLIVFSGSPAPNDGEDGKTFIYKFPSKETPDTIPPSAPTNLTATPISSSQINLFWTTSTDNIGVIGYKIYRCAGSGCAPTVQIATSATNSYSDTGLTASTSYTYTVSAYDAAGNESGKSASVSVTTLSQFKQADFNKDGVVNQLDFDILKQEWRRTDKPASDLNQDGIVDSRDLGILMSSWEN